VLPIADRQLDHARSVRAQLDAAGIRATVDDRSEKVNLKIRDAQSGQAAVHHRKHANQGAKPVADCIAEIRGLIDSKAVGE
jgi:threonyl-tRNA synthetase